MAASTDLEQFLDVMEGRFDLAMAKHQQQLHDKLLASLTKMLAAHEEQHKEAKGKHQRWSHGSRVKSKSMMSVENNLALRHILSDVMPTTPASALSPTKEDDSIESVRSHKPVQRALSKKKKRRDNVPSVAALEAAMFQDCGPIGMPIGASNSHRLSHSEEHSKGTFGLHPPMNIQVSPPSCLETGEGEVLMPPDKDKEDASSAGTASVHPTLFGVPSPRPAGEIQVTPTNIQNLMKDSQSAILAEINDRVELQELELDVGSRFMLAIPKPRILTWVLGTLSFLAAMTSGSFHAFLNLGGLGLQSDIFCIFTNLVYGVLAVACIRLLRVALTSEELHLAINRLHLFVADFHLDWSEVSGQESRKYCHAWLLLVFSQVIVQGLQYYILHTSLGVVDGAYLAFMVTGVVQVLVFAACSAIVMVAAYALSHLILGLDKTLDCWCCHIVNTPHFEFGVQSWNNMQALLKCVGRELASAFIMMQALSALGFMFLLANGVAYAFRIDVDLLPTLVEGLAALPLIFLFGLGMRLFSHGASLTEKCRLVPAFVNQIPGEEGIDLDKQYLVNFIANSSAGFFVRDVKLTQEMFVKQFILVGGILSGTFGALSRIYAM
ncbi:Metal transporter CNNM4 [Durusdinium trenchii]|uniref:Metal transporter CNNM4 n=1 Tax=Durusdinium trenchii TaxID=1381693 RepID=A0ABP0PZQ6_9DINO